MITANPGGLGLVALHDRNSTGEVVPATDIVHVDAQGVVAVERVNESLVDGAAVEGGGRHRVGEGGLLTAPLALDVVVKPTLVLMFHRRPRPSVCGGSPIGPSPLISPGVRTRVPSEVWAMTVPFRAAFPLI